MMRPAGDTVLAIDIGTAQVKTAIIGWRGNVVWADKHAQALMAPRPGWAEQDAEGWWQILCWLLSGAPEESLARVASVSVTGHNPTLVCIGPEGVPRRPAITWADGRAVAEARELGARLGRAIDPSFNVAKAMWLTEHEPHVLRNACLLQSFDYIAYKLTGSVCAMSAVPGWTAWDPAQISAGDLDPALLPAPAPPLVGHGRGLVFRCAIDGLGRPAGR